jgi:3-oxoacyl-[acyl-carrier protein] reductase
MGKMDDKVVLVGGNMGTLKKEKGEFSLGLGGLVAKDLASEGAKVIIVDLDKEVADAAVKAIGSKNVKAKACDLLKDRTGEMKTFDTEKGPKTEMEWIDNPALNLVNDIVAEFGKIDVLVTNFDTFDKCKLDAMSDEFYVKMRNENITPVFHLIAGVRNQFEMQKKTKGVTGQIVMISHMVGKAGLNMATIYSAFKASIVSLTKTLAREYGRFATVNTICPGFFADKKLQGPNERMKKSYLPTQTDYANLDLKAEHVVPVVTFMCTEQALGMSGQNISVDGGLWLKLEQ